MLPEAVAALTDHLWDVGNPSSLHASGRRARRIVEEARETLASLLGVGPSEVVFTGGGTESDNLAVKGLFASRRAQDPKRSRIVASAVEHHAIIDSVDWLVASEGASVTWISVDGYGRVTPEALTHALAVDGGPSNVALATVMWANNEVGTIQPIAALAEVCRGYGIPLHSDAVQAFGSLPVDVEAAGVDALSVTGHKLGGPFGVGALVLRRGVDCAALLHGGGQERDVRSGTLDAPAIAGFAAAAQVAVRDLALHSAATAALRDDLIRRVLVEVPGAILNGDPDPAGRLPGNAHLTFPGCAGDDLLMLLDARGVECSTGSACSAGVSRPSHVLLAMGIPEELAIASLRFSLGHTSTTADIDAVQAVIGAVVERALRAAPSEVA